jgi:hypothetical protein
VKHQNAHPALKNLALIWDMNAEALPPAVKQKHAEMDVMELKSVQIINVSKIMDAITMVNA